MRLFAAVIPPADVLDDVAEFVEPRREAGASLRWTDPHQWHLTLAFMAHVPERVVEPVAEALAAGLAGRERFDLALRGGGAFPHPAAARVLWLGVTGGTEQLGALARSVRLTCAHEGAAPDGGPFHPHLTLARTRPLEATRWVRVLEGYAGPPWTVTEVALVASHLGEGRGRRPRYETVATLPLGGA